MAYLRAVALSEMWDGEMRALILNGKKVLLLNVGGELHAYEDRCCHQGVALSEGTFSGGRLLCKSHHWTYDAKTGRGIHPGHCQLRAYAVKVENDDIWIDLEVDPDKSLYDWVGPVLTKGPLTPFVLAALEEENAKLVVKDSASYFRVLSPLKCRLSVTAVSRLSGKAFSIQRDLEPIMPSFKGKYRVATEEVVWEFRE
jgi:toluene monooxygenase system ferredoxin subunit